MALVGKLEADVEIKAPADKFFNILRSEIHHIPNISSDKVHGVEVHEGDWETSGSVKLWKFTVGMAILQSRTTDKKKKIECE
ncbi:mlp-like protein 43 [Quercus suber]|uniref:Mlp-like protein 43 n=1 Tax=Quercus suber TaxID=58331 RepID=A0AAW0JLD7_QUESU